MPNCLICKRKTNYKPMCECDVCLYCMIKQFGKNTKNEEFRCPNKKCKCLYSLTYLKNKCKNNPYKAQLESLLDSQQKSDVKPVIHKTFGQVECGISLTILIGLSIHLLLSQLHMVGVFHYFISDQSLFECVQIFFIVNFLLFGLILTCFIFGFLLIAATKADKIKEKKDKLEILAVIIILIVVWLICYWLVNNAYTWFNINILDIVIIIISELTIYLLYKRTLPEWLPLGFIAFQLFYFLGINGIFMATWLIPYWGNIVNGHRYLIASYAGLILQNFSDIWGLLMSYQFIIMIIIDLLSQKGKNHKYNILHQYLEFVGFRGKRWIK